MTTQAPNGESIVYFKKNKEKEVHVSMNIPRKSQKEFEATLQQQGFKIKGYTLVRMINSKTPTKSIILECTVKKNDIDLYCEKLIDTFINFHSKTA